MTKPLIAEPPSIKPSAAPAANGAFKLPDYILAQIRDFDYLPSSAELIFDDDTPMETPRHHAQMELLLETLRLHWTDRDDYYAGGNMFVYFSPNQVKNEDFRGPDFFVVLGVDGTRERLGWVIWEEGGKTPDLIVEMLSPSTGKTDKHLKKELYLTGLGGPEYFWYDPFGSDFTGFAPQGRRYVELKPDERGRLISRKLGLALVRWEGEYQKITASWLRWETLDGKLLPTNAELAAQERARAEQAEVRIRRAENRLRRERKRAKSLEAQLRALGIDPETLK